MTVHLNNDYSVFKERLVPRELRRPAGHSSKDLLRHFRRRVLVAVRAAQCRGIDQAEVPLHKHGNVRFRACLGVAAQKFSL